MEEQNNKGGEQRRQTVLDNEMIDGMVDHLTLYLRSANMYRTLGLMSKELGLLGCGDYLFIQRKERSHSATELHKFLDAAGAKFVIPEIPECTKLSTLTDIESIFDLALDNEIEITDSLNSLASMAIETHQHTAYSYIQEELKFQLGEESEARDRIAIVKAATDPLSADLKITSLIKKRNKKKNN